MTLETKDIKYVILKKGKYLSGWGSKGYAGKKFFWTDDPLKAHTFEADDSNSDYFAELTKGKVIGLALNKIRQ